MDFTVESDDIFAYLVREDGARAPFQSTRMAKRAAEYITSGQLDVKNFCWMPPGSCADVSEPAGTEQDPLVANSAWEAIGRFLDLPKAAMATAVFIQSKYVGSAYQYLQEAHELGTGSNYLMVLRATEEPWKEGVYVQF